MPGSTTGFEGWRGVESLRGERKDRVPTRAWVQDVCGEHGEVVNRAVQLVSRRSQTTSQKQRPQESAAFRSERVCVGGEGGGDRGRVRDVELGGNKFLIGCLITCSLCVDEVIFFHYTHRACQSEPWLVYAEVNHTGRLERQIDR